MSFGWSAGDIATAIKVAYDLIEALDSYDGAGGDYCERVAFLRDLNHTLDPAWNTYHTYGQEYEKGRDISGSRLRSSWRLF